VGAKLDSAKHLSKAPKQSAQDSSQDSRLIFIFIVELKRFPFILLTDHVVFPEIQTRAQARAFVISPLVQIKLSYLLLP
jgi:hypothetical protein